MTYMTRKCRQYGFVMFARHCFRLGVPFCECYETIFGRYPNRFADDLID